MPRYKVFCVTRDEYDLIEDFIVFYAHLFGLENVHIIDNNSRHPHVLHVYQKYIPRGLHVVYESNYQNLGQGDAFTKHMCLWKDACDFLIGLDTDEFMFVDTPSCQSVSQPASKPVTRSDIDAVFEAIPSHVTKLKISSYLWSIPDPSHPAYIQQQTQYPARNIVTFENRPLRLPKLFYRSHAFKSTHNGNHEGQTTNNVTQTISIGLHHYHACGQYRSFERARHVMDGYKYLDVEAPLHAQIDQLQQSIHTIRYGDHRAQEYQTFLIRAFLVELFVRYCARLPTLEELDRHVQAKRSHTSTAMEQAFQTCEEAKQMHRDSSSNVASVTVSEDQKRSLVYCDPPISQTWLRRTIIHETLLLAPYAQHL